MEGIIHFFLEDCQYRLRFKTAIRSWLNQSIQHEGLKTGQLNIILCSDHYLHKMNVEHLNHDTFTDIITFDYCSEVLISGDLFISVDRVKENAREAGVLLVDELHRVMIHGVLHLCGYKDKSLNDKQLMTDKEDFYLSLRSF